MRLLVSHPERRAALGERSASQVREVDGAALQRAVGRHLRHRQRRPRELRLEEREVELGVVRDQGKPLQRRADLDGEVREARGAGDVRVGDAVDVGGAHRPARVEARHPLVDRSALLVGPEDRELQDPLPLRIQPRGLHVDHREARSARRGGRRRCRRRRGTSAEAIEQSHEDPLRAGAVIARSSQGAGTEEALSAWGPSMIRLSPPGAIFDLVTAAQARRQGR